MHKSYFKDSMNGKKAAVKPASAGKPAATNPKCAEKPAVKFAGSLDSDTLRFYLNEMQSGRLDFPQMISKIEAQMLRYAMQQASGNQSQAAKSLGITRTTLQGKLKKYGL